MDLIKFFIEVGKLKRLHRSGWVIDNVKNPESVAEHSYRLALFVLVLGEGRTDIDVDKAVKMALIHDIAESKTGDIVIKEKWNYSNRIPKGKFSKITAKEKFELEKNAFKGISSILGEQGEEYFKLWQEFEGGKTNESRFVNQLDNLETVLQAMEYELEEKKDLQHYFDYYRKGINDPALLKILDEIEAKRHK